MSLKVSCILNSRIQDASSSARSWASQQRITIVLNRIQQIIDLI
jgi:hypothetical protein